MQRTARVAATLLTTCIIAAFSFVLPVPAGAQFQVLASEQIEEYRVDIQIDDQGDLLVTEVITYDFGLTPKHGIFRDIPYKFYFDEVSDRVMPISDVEVTSQTPGTPVDVEEGSVSGGYYRLKIGDPDRTVTGRHEYMIRYHVEGALNAFPETGQDELYWNAIGLEWDVPIERASAQVSAPAKISRITCFAGPQFGTTPCTKADTKGTQAAFRQDGLGPQEALTIVVAFPSGAVPTPTVILEERFNPARSFTVSPQTVLPAVGLSLLILGGLIALGWRVGRDRRAQGDYVSVAFATGEQADEAVPVMADKSSPVEFAPPESLRPGLLGTLIDEVANPVDVTATIIDLAVRGYLQIEEVPKEGFFGKDDWRLRRLTSDEGLLTYERRLFNSLFRTGEEVELSSLKATFASELADVQESLYVETVKQGWFRSRPDSVRSKWHIVGFLATVAGIGILVFSFIFTHAALVALPLAFGGIALWICARWMPARTAKGTGVLRRTMGFRYFITDSEAIRARFAEDHNIFTEYLPYAVAFGVTKKWAKAFRGLEEQLPDASYWYLSSRPFHVDDFCDRMDGFSTSCAGTLASTPAGSGSSGFGGGGSSGGGGGGGGGGSW